MSNQPNPWYCGPGRYFWTSEARLADLELGYCANWEDLSKAIRDMIHVGREEMEVGGLAYRAHGMVTSRQNKPIFSNNKIHDRKNEWRAPFKLSA